MRISPSIIVDVINDMRYHDSAGMRGLYWFIKIGSILLAILLIVLLVMFIYTKVKGISIVSPF